MRHILTALALYACLLAPAKAQPVPFLADVTGVAENDALNIRENPRGTAARLGELAPDARNIEVVEVSDSGDWARINFAETTGWVALRFLAARPSSAPAGTLFDNGLICFGTEPHWALTVRRGAGNIILSRADGADLRLTRLHAGTSANMGPHAQALIARTDPHRLTATLRRTACDNGMSDNLYALQLDIVLEGGETPVLLSGCCSLQAE